MITMHDGDVLDNGLCVFYCPFDSEISITVVRWQHSVPDNQHIIRRVAYGFDPQTLLDEIVADLKTPADATEIGAIMSELCKAAKEQCPNKTTCSTRDESEKTPK